jgi:hypothetical protein
MQIYTFFSCNTYNQPIKIFKNKIFRLTLFIISPPSATTIYFSYYLFLIIFA